MPLSKAVAALLALVVAAAPGSPAWAALAEGAGRPGAARPAATPALPPGAPLPPALPPALPSAAPNPPSIPIAPAVPAEAVPAAAPAPQAAGGEAAPVAAPRSSFGSLRAAAAGLAKAPARLKSAALDRLFGAGGRPTEEPSDEALPDLERLSARLRASEAQYLSSVAQPAVSEQHDEPAVRALATLSRRAAQAREPKGWRAWSAEKLAHFTGELKEKVDLRGTVAGIKKLALVEGARFAVFAIAVEVVEDVVVPFFLHLAHYDALIPVMWAIHTEPVVYPIYFAVRLLMRRRALWKLSGGRARYKATRDFRARLLNEDPERRIEKLVFDGFPSLSAHGTMAANVNRSRLPLWVPLPLRNLVDAKYRWYDLYISINELALLAPRAIVKQLRRYYKEYRGAVAYLLARSALDAGETSRARLVQNLAFKYWLNIGFNDLQPTILPFLDPAERALVERNRSFSSVFFLQATPREQRSIKTFVADVFALAAVTRAARLDDASRLDALAPFLADSYPRSRFTAADWRRSPQAIARTHFLLQRLSAQGRLADGPLKISGEAVAVVEGGQVRYLDAAGARLALARYRSSLNGAAQFLARYERGEPGALSAAGFDRTRALKLTQGPAPSGAPSLLTKIHWLRQTVLPDAIESLTKRRESGAAALKGRAKSLFKRRMKVRVQQARALLTELENIETKWLSDYYDHRFVSDESEVPGYAEAAGRVRELERRVGPLSLGVAGLVIAGPPGSGKGTYSKRLAADYGLVHISAGEVLRDYAKTHPEIAKLMAEGHLVPADLVTRLMKERLSQDDVRRSGFILDGFPRELEQARALRPLLAELGMPLDAVLHLDVPEDVLLKRILRRGRADDTAEVFAERMRVYYAQTRPVIEYLREGSPLLEPALGDFDEDASYAEVQRALEALRR